MSHSTLFSICSDDEVSSTDLLHFLSSPEGLVPHVHFYYHILSLRNSLGLDHNVWLILFFQLYFVNMYFNRQIFSFGQPSFYKFPFGVCTHNSCCTKFGSHYSQSLTWQLNYFSGFYMDMLYLISFSLSALEIEVKSISWLIVFRIELISVGNSWRPSLQFFSKVEAVQGLANCELMCKTAATCLSKRLVCFTKPRTTFLLLSVHFQVFPVRGTITF